MNEINDKLKFNDIRLEKNDLSLFTNYWNKSISLLKELIKNVSYEKKTFFNEIKNKITAADIKKSNAFESKFGYSAVRPNNNYDDQKYYQVRDDDLYIHAIERDENLQFTRKEEEEKDNLFTLTPKLIMPMNTRRVEIEDLNRNFWVISQYVGAVTEYLFDKNSSKNSVVNIMFSELVQLWENILFLWLYQAIRNEKTKGNIFQVVYLQNSDIQTNQRYDNYYSEKEIKDFSLDDIIKKISYLKSKHPNFNLCILPAFKLKNYQKNYYSGVYLPGIYFYRVKTGEEYFYYFKEKNGENEKGLTINFDDYGSDIFAINFNDECLFPFKKVSYYVGEENSENLEENVFYGGLRIDYGENQVKIDKEFYLEDFQIKIIDGIKESYNIKKINIETETEETETEETGEETETEETGEETGEIEKIIFEKIILNNEDYKLSEDHKLLSEELESNYIFFTREKKKNTQKSIHKQQQLSPKGFCLEEMISGRNKIGKGEDYVIVQENIKYFSKPKIINIGTSLPQLFASDIFTDMIEIKEENSGGLFLSVKEEYQEYLKSTESSKDVRVPYYGFHLKNRDRDNLNRDLVRTEGDPNRYTYWEYYSAHLVHRGQCFTYDYEDEDGDIIQKRDLYYYNINNLNDSNSNLKTVYGDFPFYNDSKNEDFKKLFINFENQETEDKKSEKIKKKILKYYIDSINSGIINKNEGIGKEELIYKGKELIKTEKKDISKFYNKVKNFLIHNFGVFSIQEVSQMEEAFQIEEESQIEEGSQIDFLAKDIFEKFYSYFIAKVIVHGIIFFFPLFYDDYFKEELRDYYDKVEYLVGQLGDSVTKADKEEIFLEDKITYAEYSTLNFSDLNSSKRGDPNYELRGVYPFYCYSNPDPQSGYGYLGLYGDGNIDKYDFKEKLTRWIRDKICYAPYYLLYDFSSEYCSYQIKEGEIPDAKSNTIKELEKELKNIDISDSEGFIIPVISKSYCELSYNDNKIKSNKKIYNYISFIIKEEFFNGIGSHGFSQIENQQFYYVIWKIDNSDKMDIKAEEDYGFCSNYCYLSAIKKENKIYQNWVKSGETEEFSSYYNPDPDDDQLKMVKMNDEINQDNMNMYIDNEGKTELAIRGEIIDILLNGGATLTFNGFDGDDNNNNRSTIKIKLNSYSQSQGGKRTASIVK